MTGKSFAVIVGCVLSASAHADLIFDATVQLSAQGFGSAPRDLTIQHTGPAAPNDFESGCVGIASGGAFVVGPAGCRTNDATIDPNGVIPVGGDEPSPLNDNQKYGAPTLASRGITNAGQIGILFNATEPGGDSINVTDITLNFFTPTGTFIGSIDGQQSFASSFPGNGVAGFVFRVDTAEQAVLNALIFGQPNFGSIIMTLNSSLTGATAGPDSFRIVNLASPGVVPEPNGLALLGLAVAVLALVVRSRRR